MTSDDTFQNRVQANRVRCGEESPDNHRLFIGKGVSHSSLTTGGHAPVVHVIPSAYAYPSPLASPQDVKPPSYSLVVEKPPLYPTGGDVDKAKI